MLLFKHACDFFSRFLVSRKYKIQIVARVGRRSAVVLSGLMEASYSHFFIGRGFESQRALLENRQARNIYPNKTPSTSGVEESNSPRRVLLLLLSDSSGGHHLKKKHVCNTSSQLWNKTLLLTKNNLPRKSIINRWKSVTIATRNTPQQHPSNPEIRGAIWGGLLRKHPPKGCPFGSAPKGDVVLALRPRGNTALGEGSVGRSAPPWSPPIHTYRGSF